MKELKQSILNELKCIDPWWWIFQAEYEYDYEIISANRYFYLRELYDAGEELVWLLKETEDEIRRLEEEEHINSFCL